MASIKVIFLDIIFHFIILWVVWWYFFSFGWFCWNLKERLGQLQDAQKGAEVTSEATERELELEAQLVEARSIIQEQVLDFYIQFE